MHRELLIGGHFIGGACDQSVGASTAVDPFTGKTIGTAAEASWTECNAAIEAATESFQAWRNSPRRDRQALLRRIAALVRERSAELADLLVVEVGKPITWAEGEVTRLALTFDFSADLLATFGPESLPADFDARGDDYRISVERFPIGTILGVVPYNWPYNLAAHKVAPAIATGNTIILKASHQATLSTLTLARLIHEAGCPPGVLNALNCESALAEKMVLDRRIKMLSFTGSPAVGWKLKEKLPTKKVSLELGGDATAIVHSDADLDWATKRIISGKFGYAGQICISIQHVLIHKSIYADVRSRLIAATQACPTGDPKLKDTVCGPVISESAAERIEAWVQEAISAGATLLAGGSRRGTLIEPTLLESVPFETNLGCKEVFGPVLTIAPFETIEDAIAQVNRSSYGIHCGVFTRDIRVAYQVYRDVEIGGVIVDDYPTLRFDNMPYGGVKQSGFGREGVRYAMDEMTEPKTLVVKVR